MCSSDLNTLVMIIIMTTVVQVFKVPVATIQSVYGEVPNHFPTFKIPEMSVEMIMNLIAPSITLAILIAIVSFLSCVVIDGLIGKRHNSTMELIA